MTIENIIQNTLTAARINYTLAMNREDYYRAHRAARVIRRLLDKDCALFVQRYRESRGR